MTQYETAQKVVDAWVIPGVNHTYHKYQQDALRRNWPTLYHAIRQLVKEHQ